MILRAASLKQNCHLQAGVTSVLWRLASKPGTSNETKIAVLRLLVQLTSSPCIAALELLEGQAVPALVHMLTQPEGATPSADGAGLGNNIPEGGKAPAPAGSMADVQELCAVLLSQVTVTSGQCLEQVRVLCAPYSKMGRKQCTGSTSEILMVWTCHLLC
jgi:hypothetical protein